MVMKDSDSQWHRSWAGWREVAVRTAAAMTADHASLIAAGCAFYAMAAFFPAISTLIAVYGLMFDPRSVEPAMRPLHGLMPHSVFLMLEDWVRTVLYQERHYYGYRLAVSSALAILSSMLGTRSIMQALNLAFHETERRRGAELLAVAMALTLGGMVAASLAIGLVVALPEILRALGVHHDRLVMIRFGAAAVALVFVMAAITLLYRFGPSRPGRRWAWISLGSVVATVIWVAASEGFSVYTTYYSRLAGRGGPLASALLMMGWFYVSAYALLLGGELNAQMERQGSDEICQTGEGMS